METDPLQQLRDIHLPADPGWWPPAPGWWILALLITFAVIWFAGSAVQQWRARAPIRAARNLYQSLLKELQAGAISEIQFAHRCNEILKRLLVHGLHRPGMAALAGDQWLRALDEISATEHFTNGGGQILGEDRFRQDYYVDVPSLETAMSSLLAGVRP